MLFYVHIVGNRELSSPRLVQSASCLVRKLTSPRDVQSASWQSASWRKFHYISWFGGSSELAPNMFGASSEPASVMEFGFNMRFTRV